MKKTLALLLILVLLLSLCACGFGSGRKAESLVGAWTLVGLTMDGQDYSSLVSMFNMSLFFEPGGTGLLTSMEEEVPLTWNSRSFTDGDEEFLYSFDEAGSLCFETDGMRFVFQRSS